MRLMINLALYCMGLYFFYTGLMTYQLLDMVGGVMLCFAATLAAYCAENSYTSNKKEGEK